MEIVEAVQKVQAVQIDQTPSFILPRVAGRKACSSDTGHVPTDEWMKTDRAGLYAVGDIRQNSARQAITAAGDGATAAIAAYRYIKDTFPPIVSFDKR